MGAALKLQTPRPIEMPREKPRPQLKLVDTKVKRIRFHDLRHTGATLMIADGYDFKTVQEICGHKDISTTMRYVHLLGDSIRKVAQGFSVAPQRAPVLKLVSTE